MKTTTGVLAAALLAAAAGCGKKAENNAPVADPKIVAPENKPAEKPPEPTALTAGEVGKRVSDCFALFNDRNMDGFKGCLAADITHDIVGMSKVTGLDEALRQIGEFHTAFSDIRLSNQLTLVNGTNVVTVDLLTGTNDGELMGAPATNKKMGMLVAHSLEVDPIEGVAKTQRVYMDAGTLMGQLGMSPAPHRALLETGADSPTLITAADSDVEKANIEATQKAFAAMNGRDMASYVSMIDDKVVFHDQAMPSDVRGKAAMEKMLKMWMTAFPDAKIETTTIWAAGDYVVTEAVWTGKNTGKMPEMGIKKPTNRDINFRVLDVMRIADGKLAESWSFMNGAEMATQLGLMPPPASE